MPEFSFYAFNYIEDEDKIDKYLNIIKSIQKKGTYILLGFSAGASLVLEISKKMKNENVLIILMDGFFGEINKDEVDKKVNEYIIDTLKLENNNKFLNQVLKSKIESYISYLENRNCIKVSKDIHIMQSEEMSNREVDLLKELTTGNVIAYKAYGNHLDLISPKYIEKNVTILKEILKKFL